MRVRLILCSCFCFLLGLSCGPARSTAPSGDATLQDFVISGGTLKPAFASTTFSYAVTVPHGTASVTVTPTATDAKVKLIQLIQDDRAVGSMVSGASSGPLSVPQVGASTTIAVKVTAEDGVTTLTYSLNLTQSGNTDASLSSLAVSAGELSPAFASGTLSYSVTAPSGAMSLTVTPTASDAHVKSITVSQDNGPPAVVASGHASVALTVPDSGSTLSSRITITVTAQDGATSKKYTLNLSRGANTEASLSSLVVSAGELSPAFASGTLSYSLTAPSGTASLTVTPTAIDAHAKSITISQDNGAPAEVASGHASVALMVPEFGSFAPSTVTITVTAQDGTTSKSYILNLTRRGSSDASLSSLVVGAGELSPAFASGTLSYSVTVPFRTDSLTVTPTATDAHVKSIAVKQDTGSPVEVASGHASGALTVPVLGNSSTINLVVTAEDGRTTQTYKVALTRANAKDASLFSLVESSGLLTGFSPSTLDYSLRIPFQRVPFSVTPTASDPTATIKVNNAAATSGSATAVTLSEGTNTVTIEVTSPDGTVVKSYVLTITNARGLLNPRTVPVAPSELAKVSNGVMTPSGTTGANVPIDTLLRIGFDSAPTLGTSGKIRIFEIDGTPTGTLVDVIDLADGATYGSMTTTKMRLSKTEPLVTSMVNIIGGTSSQTSLVRFVYYIPVVISGNTVTIFPHKNRLTYDGSKYSVAQTLEYGASYYVSIDKGVLNGSKNGVPFDGISDSETWKFSTKAAAPSGVVDSVANQTTFAVNWDNSGDFATVQGAIDAVPKDNSSTYHTIAIAPGVYQELLFSGNKKRMTLKGTSGNNGVDTVIQYDNCEAFNSGAGTGTNVTAIGATVTPGAGGGRAVYLISGAATGGFIGGDEISLDGITLKNTHGQGSAVLPTLPPTTLTSIPKTNAEALSFNSTKSTLRAKHSNFVSHQNTLQVKGFVWFYDSFITGDVDFVWGGLLNVGLFEQCEVKSRFSAMGVASIAQARAANGYPGFVFLNSALTREDGSFSAFLARSAGSTAYSDNVAYISCTFDSHVEPAGWGLMNALAVPKSQGSMTAPTPIQGWRQYGNATPAGLPVDTSAYLSTSGTVIGSMNLSDANAASFFKDRATILKGASDGTYTSLGMSDASMVWSSYEAFFSP